MTMTTERPSTTPAVVPAPAPRRFAGFVERVRGGDLGSLPVIVGLLVIWGYFQARNSQFLSPLNLTNLTLQIAAVGTISVGIYLVLLLGEIDLAVGSVSGASAAVLAVLTTRHGWPAVLGMLAALVVGAAIGAFHGLVFTRLGVPSFVVTLAGNIGWLGMHLKVLGPQGSINMPESDITRLTSTFLHPAIAWLAVAGVVAVHGAVLVNRRRRRIGAGLEAGPVASVVLRTGLLAAALSTAVAWVNRDRGVPLAALIFVGFVVIADVVTTRTRSGRSLFAVGGNVEAARRAGIKVNRVRLSVFMISGTMAAAGGILAASRLLAVNQSSGGGDVLLNSIAAVVIGGTSLFGGRGRAYSALLGILVIGSISNGMDLLGLESSVKFMITGAVLLGAVTIDAIARRGRQASGRA
jgi:D-xylose transport system permease protein